jgi:hypothetical protein
VEVACSSSFRAALTTGGFLVDARALLGDLADFLAVFVERVYNASLVDTKNRLSLSGT